MDELGFKHQLAKWLIRERVTIIPTSNEVRLYGQQHKTRIISKEHEHLIYASIKDLEINEDLYKQLSEQQHLTDHQCLVFVQKTYEEYLKGIRTSIRQLQSSWSRNFCQFRATQVITHLEYSDIYEICDLVDQRIVPIELVLKVIFDVNTKYGEHRRIKQHDEVHVDERVLRRFNDLKSQNY